MKYAPLQEHLKALPASKKGVTLRFEEIEKLIKAKLPKSASEYQEWWVTSLTDRRLLRGLAQDS